MEDLNIVQSNQGITLKGAEKLLMKKLRVSKVKNCQTFNYCGIVVEKIKNFLIQHSIIEDSDSGFMIKTSDGIIEDSKAIKVIRPSSNTNGGGLFVLGGNIKTINLDLIGNEASNGGGFYCGSAKLSMIGGKIYENKALSGGAGQCLESHCKFSISGADIQKNKQKQQSKCIGIPNSLEKLF